MINRRQVEMECQIGGCANTATHTVEGGTDEGGIALYCCDGCAEKAIGWALLDIDHPEVAAVQWTRKGTDLRGEAYEVHWSINCVYGVIPAVPLEIVRLESETEL